MRRPNDRHRPLIIERPELQTRAQRYAYLSVTFLCWFLWLYLFVPLLSLAAWAVGAVLVYQVMIQNLELGELLDLLRIYGTGIAALTAVYLSWAVSSWLRFRNMDRRGPPADASGHDLAASHHLSLAELEELRRATQLVIATEQLDRMFAPASDSRRRGPPGATEAGRSPQRYMVAPQSRRERRRVVWAGRWRR